MLVDEENNSSVAKISPLKEKEGSGSSAPRKICKTMPSTLD